MPLVDDFVVSLVGTPRPRICFVPTASGDSTQYMVRFFEAFPARSFDTSVLELFGRRVRDVAALIAEQDVIYVGGGNTANMLSIWRTHGLDVALREAWNSGVVLAGTSAGANCWFDASTTDSFLLGTADPLLDGLGFLAGSFCPHYDAEAARRPSFHELVGRGALPPGIACDEPAAVHFVDTEISQVVTAKKGACAYSVVPGDGGIAVETPLQTRILH
jgi:peptidase E